MLTRLQFEKLAKLAQELVYSSIEVLGHDTVAVIVYSNSNEPRKNIEELVFDWNSKTEMWELL